MDKYGHGGDIYGNPGVELDFSVNTNPLGMPDEVRRALLAHVDEYARYPDPLCRQLRAAIAAHENKSDCGGGLSEDMVLCGNGAADLIYRLCYAAKPRRALVCAPAFSEYERALTQAGCEVSHHRLEPGNQFNLTAEIEDRLTPGLGMLFLCHPNNPTGRLIPEDLLARILRRAGRNRIRVVVDECFLDFTDGVSAKRYLREIPGLAVLKAFTKTYAMAGLRLGYLLTADRAWLDKTNAAAPCWSVSVPAQIAGAAALACAGWLEKTRRVVAEERRFLSEGLTGLGITVFPSDANFLLLRREPGADAGQNGGRPAGETDRPGEDRLYAPLLSKGLLIRPCGNFKGLDASYYRTGVKTRPENRRLLQAVKEIVYG